MKFRQQAVEIRGNNVIYSDWEFILQSSKDIKKMYVAN